jgi:hypothetical protein
MVRDFGAGLSADELIGLTAWQIARLELPKGDAFKSAQRGAQALARKGADNFILEELWADGHSVWRNSKTEGPAVVTPDGQILQGQE